MFKPLLSHSKRRGQENHSPREFPPAGSGETSKRLLALQGSNHCSPRSVLGEKATYCLFWDFQNETISDGTCNQNVRGETPEGYHCSCNSHQGGFRASTFPVAWPMYWSLLASASGMETSFQSSGLQKRGCVPWGMCRTFLGSEGR